MWGGLVLLFELLESLSFLGLHPAVLLSPAMECWFTAPQRLNYLSHRLPWRQHRVRLPKLLDDLLGGGRLRRVLAILSLLALMGG